MSRDRKINPPSFTQSISPPGNGGCATPLDRRAAPFFPGVAPALFLTALQRYKQAGIWGTTPDISRAGFARLAQSIQSGGFVKTIATYEDCVAVI